MTVLDSPATSSATSSARPARTDAAAALPEFYRYPSGRLVAVVEAADLDRLLDGLTESTGVSHGVQVMSGTDGRRRLDHDGSRHGWGARLQRTLIGALLSDSQNPLTAMDRALRAGAVLVAVPSKPRGAARGLDLEQTLIEHGARQVWRFTRWTVSTRTGRAR